LYLYWFKGLSRNPFIQDAICDDTVTTLKYYKRGEAFIPLSALMGKALFIFWVRQEGLMVQIVRIIGIIEMVPMNYGRPAPHEFHPGLS